MAKRRSPMPVAEMVDLEIEGDHDDSEQSREEEERAERERILNAIGLELAKLRTEAIAARQTSGIEDEWNEDEEFYEGIDDRNRGEAHAWRTKPMGVSMAETSDGDKDNGSTIFFNVTRPYVDMAAARVGDMLLPTDDRGWSLQPTPVPELAELVEGKMPRRLMKQIEQAFPYTDDDDDEHKATQQAAIAKTAADLIEDEQKRDTEAKEKAKRAQERIDDWHVESGYAPEMRRVIKSAAKIGTGVLKGPVPQVTTQRAYKGGKLIKEQALKPVSHWIDPWNLFPDPGCGQNIHNGSHIFERDDLSPKSLADLLDDPSYIAEQIELALKEGPQRATKEFKDGGDGRAGSIGNSYSDMKHMYEIWYYHGQLTREQLEVCGCDFDEKDDAPVQGRKGEGSPVRRDKRYDVVVTMVNARVIKAALNPLETGDLPYDVMVWQERIGHWAGIGVARQIRSPQKMIVAAARNMMDNAGLAGGPMWGYNDELIEPLDGYEEIAPRKGWRMKGDDPNFDIKKALTFVEFPMKQEELQALIMLGLKMCEDVTGMPMIMQGQMGQSAPDTLGGMQMLQNNAGAPLRRVAKLFDDNITEPSINRYYAYLMQDPNVPDEEKGDFVVDARGSSALVERDLNNQAIAQMGQLVLNPVFGLDPKKWMEQFLKSQHLDPELFKYDSKKWQQVVEQLSQPPANPAIDVAKIRAQTDMQMAQEKNQLAVALAAMEHEGAQNAQQMEIAQASVDQFLKQLELAGASNTAREKIKADLAKVVMELSAQERMASNDHAHEAAQVATSPAEPPGRAPKGKAFQA